VFTPAASGEDRFTIIEAIEPELPAHQYTELKLSEKAIPLGQKAGSLALGRLALAEAIGHPNRGPELVAALPPFRGIDVMELDLRTLLGTACIALKGALQESRTAYMARWGAASLGAYTAFDEQGIAELMCSVMTVIELNVDLAQRRLVEEGAQQRVMAGTGLMGAGEDGIDDPKIRAGADPFRSDAAAASYDAVIGDSSFKGAHDRGADGNDTVAVGARRIDCRCGRRRDRIRLVQR
jgi:hypothetical protein